MASLGVLLIVVGIGSLLLPIFDIQFRLMQLLDDYQPIAGIVIGAVGAVLVVLSRRRTTVVAPSPTEPPLSRTESPPSSLPPPPSEPPAD